jgi:hypothetical protein
MIQVAFLVRAAPGIVRVLQMRIAATCWWDQDRCFTIARRPPDGANSPGGAEAHERRQGVVAHDRPPLEISKVCARSCTLPIGQQLIRRTEWTP